MVKIRKPCKHDISRKVHVRGLIFGVLVAYLPTVPFFPGLSRFLHAKTLENGFVPVFRFPEKYSLTYEFFLEKMGKDVMSVI